MMRRPKPLTLTVLAMTYFPLAAVLALIGYTFGWRFPVAALVLLGTFSLRWRRTSAKPRAVGKGRTVAELIVFSLVGMVVGGLLLGAAGVLFGFLFGFCFRLSEIPITSVR
jgi:hypothetical protein